MRPALQIDSFRTQLLCKDSIAYQFKKVKLLRQKGIFVKKDKKGKKIPTDITRRYNNVPFLGRGWFQR